MSSGPTPCSTVYARTVALFHTCRPACFRLRHPTRPAGFLRLVDALEHVVLMPALHSLARLSLVDELVNLSADQFRVRASLTRHGYCTALLIVTLSPHVEQTKRSTILKPGNVF